MDKFITNFKENDIDNLENLILTAQKYLNGNIGNSDIITTLNSICTIYLQYEDPNLLMFKGIWSQIDDIKEAIEAGRETQKDLDEYIDSVIPSMKESCEELIEQYSPILEELKKKYPRLEKEEKPWWEET